jgi:hypothetical protein
MWKWAVVLVIVGFIIIIVAIGIAANSTKFNKKCCKPPHTSSSTCTSTCTSTSISTSTNINSNSTISGSAKRRGQRLSRSQGTVLTTTTADSLLSATDAISDAIPDNGDGEGDGWDVKSVVSVGGMSSDGHLSSSEDVEEAGVASSGNIVSSGNMASSRSVKGLPLKRDGDGGELSWGLRKSRHVLPYSSAHESACMAAYACSPFTQELVTSGRSPLSKSLSKSVSKAVAGFKSPCDATVISVPKPLFDKSHRRYWFGIGINYISQPKSRLTSCWNDIDRLRSEFAKRYGAFDQNWVITDRPGGGIQPTSGSVRKTWVRLLTEAAKQGNVQQHIDLILVFSGHGTFRLTSDPGELGGQSDALILLDQLMYDYDVMAQIVRPLGNHVHLLIVFDSCNSGSAANLPWTYNPISHTVNQTSLHTDLTNDVVMISGCRDEQTSQAGATTKDLSECTRVLVETFKENPKPHTLLATDLIKTMRNKLVAAKDTQIPQLSLSKPQLLQTLL